MSAAKSLQPAKTSLSPRRMRLAELDRLLAQDSDDLSALFERASLWREQGDYEAAKRDYVEFLRRKPTDFGALNDFGTMVLKAGYKEAARSLFSAAV
jgi:Tfp pilus assembly protein PilF